MTCGIYKIVNTDNGKVYVGSSKNIERRWDEHKKLLAAKKHHSAKLQHAWTKVKGNLPLIFEVIEECELPELLTREQVWMDHHKAYTEGYNCTSTAKCSPNQVKTSVWVKSEEKLDLLFENLYEFDQIRNTSSANNVVVSYFGLGLEKASSQTAFISRMHKASGIILSIANDLEYCDQEKEYRIHYINYIGEGGGYKITEEGNSSKKAKHSMHNKTKKTGVLKTIWEEIEETCFTGRLGRGIKERYDEYLSRLSEE